MNNSELADSLAASNGLTKSDAKALVDAEIKRLGGVEVADEPETAALVTDGSMTATMKPPAGRLRKS